MRLAALFLTVLLTACGGVEMYGIADDYEKVPGGAERNPKDGTEVIEVVMDPNALFISQQFRPGTETGADAHLGMDVWGPIRTPILAAADGVVVAAYYEPVYGNRIEIDHGRDAQGVYHETSYLHLKELQVREGDRVRRGQQIATMGATGAMGMLVHLHFEVQSGADRQSATRRDPHLYWTRGVGRVTCYDPAETAPPGEFRITYPVKCREPG